MKRAGFVLALAATLLALPVVAGPKIAAVSKGFPNGGRLLGGKKWSDTKHVKQLSGHAGDWGMPSLIAMIHKSAERVAQKHKGSVLMVGDLSAKEGGPLAGHQSHQSGRDIDVGFYVTDDGGKPARAGKFLAFAGDGKAKDGSHLRFDDERNWELVQTMLLSNRANVRAVFVSTPLKLRLLKQAEARGASKDLKEKVAATLMQPPNAEPHDDHFHVRIACVPTQKDVCRDDSFERGARRKAPGGDGSGEALGGGEGAAE